MNLLEPEKNSIETTLYVTARKTIHCSACYDFLQAQLRELLADLHPERITFIKHFFF